MNFNDLRLGGRALAAPRFRESMKRCAPGQRCFRAWVETTSGQWILVGQVGSTTPRLAALKIVRQFVYKRGYHAQHIAVDEAKSGAHGKHNVTWYTFRGFGPKLTVKRTLTGKAYGGQVGSILATPPKR